MKCNSCCLESNTIYKSETDINLGLNEIKKSFLASGGSDFFEKEMKTLQYRFSIVNFIRIT